MTPTTTRYVPPAAEPRPVPDDLGPETRTDYLNVNFSVRSWLLTTDHKRIALLYLVVVTLMFFLGGAFAVLIRVQLLSPRGALFQKLAACCHTCALSSDLPGPSTPSSPKDGAIESEAGFSSSGSSREVVGRSGSSVTDCGSAANFVTGFGTPGSAPRRSPIPRG